MTRIITHDTLSELRPIFLSDLRPKARLELAQQTIMGEGGLFMRLQMLDKSAGGFDVMLPARRDGHDVCAGQQGWGLFNPTRKLEASKWVFDQFETHDVMSLIQRTLETVLAGFDTLPQVEAYLLPADPGNGNLMANNHGMSVYAMLPGVILIQIWPSEGNIKRLPHLLTRAAVSLIRQAHFGEATLNTLADWLVVEGLAALMIENTFDDLAAPGWGVAHAKLGDWDDSLDHLCSLYGLDSYDEMTVNI